MAAFEAAADPERYPEAGPPWQVLKIYYQHGFNRPRAIALHEAMLERGLDSPLGERLEQWKPDPAHDNRVTTRVECAEYFPVRDAALIAHATQIDPDGFFFQIPIDLQQSVWPTEDFELVKSLVETSVPEDDLFAGLRGNPAFLAEGAA